MASEYAFQGTVGFTDNADELKQFVPTLFIGLGGTGKDILMRFRKNLYDRYGMANEKFARFLVLDTDDQTDVPQGENDAVYRPVLLQRDAGEFIKCTIEPTEFKGILSRVRNEHDRRYINWLHPQVEHLIPPGALEKGAGTYRQAGRLAFFRNYERIRSGIKRHFADAMAHAADKPSTVFNGQPGQVYDDRLEVVIITSLAGGTGSGMFIDVAYLVRDILDNDPDFEFLESSHSTVVAVLPTIFTRSDPNLASRFRQNAYSALLEMEYYNTPRPEENPFVGDDRAASDTKMVEFFVNWDDPQSSEKPIRTHAWDTCYLVDDVNDRRRGASQSHSDVYQMVADYLFLDFGTSRFAIAKRSARSNHVQLRDRIISARVFESPLDMDEHAHGYRSDVLFENKYGCTFSSFGLSEIYIDKDRIDRSAAYRLAIRLIAGRWMGDPKQYSENTYQQWAKEDLQSGKPPAGETEAISFHPDDMWRELLRGDQQDWLGAVDKQFSQLEQLDPFAGARELPGVLNKNHEALSRRAAADGLAGPARRTLDSRLDELRGTASRLGKMRQRLAKLARQRFNQVGVLPTLELLKVYRMAFENAASRAGKQRRLTSAADRDLLARLADAEQVPFLCRNIARRVEYRRACQAAHESVKQRYAIAAGEHLENLANTLRAYVGSDQGGETRGGQPSLFEQYSDVRGFLEQLTKRLENRFDELQHIAQCDQKYALVPDWDKRKYDEETDLVLLQLEEVGQTSQSHNVNWANVEREVLRRLAVDESGKSISLAELVNRWREAVARRNDALPEIAEEVARACRQVLRDGIKLDKFANGNVVDYLLSLNKEQRADLLGRLVDGGAPYYPTIRDYKVEAPAAYRNLLGRTGGAGNQGQENAKRITEEVNGISLMRGIFQRDTIHRQEEGDPSSLVLVREMGGLPLHYYNRLKELEEAYHDERNAQWRKTCHIKFRENFEDLPDIELIDSELIRLIRENTHYVLWAFLLRTIRSDDEGGFIIDVPDRDFGKHTYRLGTRLSRIIKHACERDDVRAFVLRFWNKWRERATPAHLAVLYSAIKQTLELFPKVRHAATDYQDPPIFNCYKKLLTMTAQFLSESEEGRRWLGILREVDPLEEHYDRWRTEHDEVARMIREKCLVSASPELPLYQINEKGIAEIRLPGAKPDSRLELERMGAVDGVPREKVIELRADSRVADAESPAGDGERDGSARPS